MTSYLQKILFFMLIFSISISNAQKKHDNQAEIFNELKDSISYLMRSDGLEKALKLSNKYIKLAKETIDEKNKYLSKGYFIRSNINRSKSEYDNALKDIDKAISLTKDEEVKIQYYLFKGIIIAQNEGWASEKILDTYQEALDIAERNNFFYWKQSVKSRTANFYTFSGDVKKSVEIQRNIIKDLKNIDTLKTVDLRKYRLSIRNTYNYITKAFITVKQTDSAKIYNEKFYKELQKDTTYYSYWEREYFISDMLVNLIEEDINKAKYRFKQAYSKNLKIFSEDRTPDSLYYAGWIHYKEKKFKKTINTFNLMNEYFDGNVLLDYLYYRNYYRFLSKSHINLGDIKNGNKYFDLLIQSIEKSTNIQNQMKTKLKSIETEKFNIELDALKRENKNKNKIIAAIALVFILLLFVFIILKRKNTKRNKKKFEELNKRLEKMKAKKLTISKKNTKNLEIKESEIKRVVGSLRKLEDKEFYLRQDCSLVTTAKATKTNTSYLSKIVNSQFKKSFNDYINDLRIRYVLIKLKEDRVFRKYTIQSIANEIGFKSKESFNRAFKKQTGILPSYYIKQLEKN